MYKKDIGRVIGLHHPILQTGFDKECCTIKLPHAGKEMEGRREGGKVREKEKAGGGEGGEFMSNINKYLPALETKIKYHL